ncbi:efflux RND transporter permease subunit [Sphingobacterium sp. E70]|uniref:efflux RND transporter permease subunit n=1 Tax=Sphingobacterium sp. E70 TaxID=2853439 RepID=UPI00211B7B2D|nr:efflux RND transporter permease subunit [Sphingobacterium sp. E70]ULT22661.1 efflux RND transporter permease subunit [Sphingobacterium sp. E70]
MLTATFQSFRISLVILSTVPFVIVGALILLKLTGSTLNLQSYMGLIMSVGVSIANAVLLINNAESLRLKNQNAISSAIEAAKLRIRPIIMTTIAMVAGMLPMAIGFGEGGDQVSPLGRAVIGGLLFQPSRYSSSSRWYLYGYSTKQQRPRLLWILKMRKAFILLKQKSNSL